MPKELKFSLGEMIRLAREKKGIPRTQLARLTGISPNTMVKYELAQEAGGKFPQLLKLVKIARVLEIDPRWIFQRAYERLRSEEEDQFSFVRHFETDTDRLSMRLAVKDVERLNDYLENFLVDLYSIDQKVTEIQGHLKSDGSDRSKTRAVRQSTSKPSKRGGTRSGSPDAKQRKRKTS